MEKKYTVQVVNNCTGEQILWEMADAVLVAFVDGASAPKLFGHPTTDQFGKAIIESRAIVEESFCDAAFDSQQERRRRNE